MGFFSLPGEINIIIETLYLLHYQQPAIFHPQAVDFPYFVSPLFQKDSESFLGLILFSGGGREDLGVCWVSQSGRTSEMVFLHAPTKPPPAVLQGTAANISGVSRWPLWWWTPEETPGCTEAWVTPSGRQTILAPGGSRIGRTRRHAVPGSLHENVSSTVRAGLLFESARGSSAAEGSWFPDLTCTPGSSTAKIKQTPLVSFRAAT